MLQLGTGVDTTCAYEHARVCAIPRVCANVSQNISFSTLSAISIPHRKTKVLGGMVGEMEEEKEKVIYEQTVTHLGLGCRLRFRVEGSGSREG